MQRVGTGMSAFGMCRYTFLMNLKYMWIHTHTQANESLRMAAVALQHNGMGKNETER